MSTPSESRDMERVRCLEVLAASIVHEVSQPLSAIAFAAATCLQTLSAESPNLEAARVAARHALIDGKRAAAAVGRLWSLFAKTEGNNEVVDLNETAREALALSSHELERCDIQVHAELDADLPPITGDPFQLQQLILSLVTNAAEAMNAIHDRPRDLLIRTERRDAYVRLSVRDTGEGFRPGEAEMLFDAFYTTKDDGMGIGLFISRWIVENHGGAIYAALNEGPGATFSFIIPCRQL